MVADRLVSDEKEEEERDLFVALSETAWDKSVKARLRFITIRQRGRLHLLLPPPAPGSFD